MSAYSIQNIPEGDRPRERLLILGPEAMSTAELIAIILGSGSRGVTVLELAHEIVSRFGSIENLAEATISELCQIKGLGQAKAIQLRASLALGLRASKKVSSCRPKVTMPRHVFDLVGDELCGEKREVFLVVLLDVRGNLIKHETVSVGTLSNSLVHPREVFYPAIRHKAKSLILVHNHPSGDPTPSPEDFQVTETLVDIGRMMGIPVNDHVIIGGGNYVSIREKGGRF